MKPQARHSGNDWGVKSGSGKAIAQNAHIQGSTHGGLGFINQSDRELKPA
jgi:hypothetical protein